MLANFLFPGTHDTYTDGIFETMYFLDLLEPVNVREMLN
jgi:hypothetical protein